MHCIMKRVKKINFSYATPQVHHLDRQKYKKYFFYKERGSAATTLLIQLNDTFVARQKGVHVIVIVIHIIIRDWRELP